MGRIYAITSPQAYTNVLGNPPPFLDHSVFSTALRAASAAELARLTKQKAMEALLAVSRRAMALEKKDACMSESKRRINVGIDFFEEPRDKNEEER